MSKKKEETKNLEKRVSMIVEIYMEQKGREEKKELSLFIAEKVKEIIAFRDSLKKRKKIKEILPADAPPQGAPKIAPSAALGEELQGTHKTNGVAI